MKSKFFTLFALSILTLALVAGFASATTVTEWNFEANDLNPSTGSGTINLSSGLTSDFNHASDTDGLGTDGWDTGTQYIEIEIDTSDYEDLTLSFDHITDSAGTPTFKVQYSSDDGATFTDLSTSNSVTTTSATFSNDLTTLNALEDNKDTEFRILVTGMGAAEFLVIDNLKLEGSTIPQFCNSGSGAAGATDLTMNIDIRNKGEGEDNEWNLLDTITVEVEIENDKSTDFQDVYFELGFFEEGSTTNIADDFMWVSDEEEKYDFGDINSEEEGTHTFEFRVNPDKISSGDYVLMVKAYTDGAESTTCIDYSDDLKSTEFKEVKYYALIDVKQETDDDKMVIIDEESLPSPYIEASCGQEVTFTADIYNIGNKDFEDQIMVSLYNEELGINLKKVVYKDLDAGEDESVSFTFALPSDAEEKTYTLQMRTYYDYDEGKGSYETDYDEKSEETFNVNLRVEGNCVYNPEISAKGIVESGGMAGEELVVKITVKNDDTKTKTFSVSASGYTAWAELIEVSPSSITLDAGESEDVLVKLNVNSDVSGNKDFSLDLSEGEDKTTSQPVRVLIEKSGFSLITGDLISEDNWYLWGIGALNIVLVLVIIIVAVRLLRKS